MSFPLHAAARTGDVASLTVQIGEGANLELRDAHVSRLMGRSIRCFQLAHHTYLPRDLVNKQAHRPPPRPAVEPHAAPPGCLGGAAGLREGARGSGGKGRGGRSGRHERLVSERALLCLLILLLILLSWAPYQCSPGSTLPATAALCVVRYGNATFIAPPPHTPLCHAGTLLLSRATLMLSASSSTMVGLGSRGWAAVASGVVASGRQGSRSLLILLQPPPAYPPALWRRPCDQEIERMNGCMAM